MSKKVAVETPVVVAPVVAKPVQYLALTGQKKPWKDGQSGDAWLAAVSAYDGKPVKEFLAACAATPVRLTKAGNADPAPGWIRYMVKVGVLTLTTDA